MKKQKTSMSRVQKLRDIAKENGLVRRDYYATPEEHEKLKRCLVRIRKL